MNTYDPTGVWLGIARALFGISARLVAMLAGGFLYIDLFSAAAAPQAIGCIIAACACEAARRQTPGRPS